MSAADEPVAIVAGGSRGTGRSIALTLAAGGYLVVAVGRDSQALDEVCAAAAGGRVRAFAADLTDGEALDRLVAHVSETYGRLDLVVHAAGTFDHANATVASAPAWEQVVAVNAGSVVALTARTARMVAAAERGAFVLLGSTAGLTAFRDNAAYVASKHAVTGFARALFLDLRETGTRVVLLSPGNVEAGASLGAPFARPEVLLDPQDVADAVLWSLQGPPRLCPTEIVLMPQLDPWTAPAA